MGNICRSPMAEAVFQNMVNQAGLADQISSDSAGTGGWHAGEPAHRGTLSVLKRNNVPYDGRARQYSGADLNDFDYVLAMDTENLSHLKRSIEGHAEVKLFLDYARQAGTVQRGEVPDPYYDGSFDQTYDLVIEGSKALLDYLREKHSL